MSFRSDRSSIFQMAKRPLFVPAPDAPGFVRTIPIELTWAPGFALVQKSKNIRAMHEAAARIGYGPVLEVSTKASEKLGRHLSAFHLKISSSKGEVSLESAFQGSKVFRHGGPHHDIYRLDPRSAKRDPRIRNSGDIVAFEFDGIHFPTEPKTAFYDWLYLNALAEHREWLAPRLSQYAGFTDIEFNPARSVNCQARSCALFAALVTKDLLEPALESTRQFLEIVTESMYGQGTSEVLDLVDRLGDWSQIKHEILEKYAHAYTAILTQQSAVKKVLYIDAYAGTGFGIDRETGETLRGSAMRAMEVTPPFHELHFIERDDDKAAILEQVTAVDPRVTVHRAEGTGALASDLLRRCLWNDYRRALCLLDPYDLSVPFSLIQEIAQMRSVEIFYNFMIMDANRNVLWKRPDLVPPARLSRMDVVWGDRSWQEALYVVEPDLFGESRQKLPNKDVAEAFRRRLQTVAGFKFAPRPIAMKNRVGSTVYYLFFAGHNATGAKIVEDIFKKYRA